MIKQPKKRFSKFLFLFPRVLLVLLLLFCITLVILSSFELFKPYLKPFHSVRTIMPEKPLLLRGAGADNRLTPIR